MYVTDPGKFVYNKRRPLPAEEFLLAGDGRKLEVECFGLLDVVLHCKDDVRVTLENVAVVHGLAFNLIVLLHSGEAPRPHEPRRYMDS